MGPMSVKYAFLLLLSRMRPLGAVRPDTNTSTSE